eukprot:c17533_g1_i3.p1 GENE.c17533_g1_i3~~c17533_g1_i3.p1  ORF type:complete len:198 (+),score=59.79 c17533_g1_i3:108-701(+)
MLLQKQEFMILMIGPDDAGKTTLLEKIKNVYCHKGKSPPMRPIITPTVGLNIGKLDFGKYKLTIWDLGGQSSLRSIWEQYYSEAHGFIFLFDSSRPDRFNDSKLALESALTHSDLHGAPLLVIANKQDVKGSINDIHEIKNILNLSTDMIDRRIKIMTISALDGKGIDEALHWMANSISQSHERIETVNSRLESNVL